MAKITQSGGNVTLTFSYTAPTSKLTALTDDALNHLYPNGVQVNDEVDESGEPILTAVADLTNQEKADLLEARAKEHLLDMARAQHINNSADTARDTANSEVATRYE